MAPGVKYLSGLRNGKVISSSSHSGSGLDGRILFSHRPPTFHVRGPDRWGWFYYQRSSEQNRFLFSCQGIADWGESLTGPARQCWCADMA